MSTAGCFNYGCCSCGRVDRCPLLMRKNTRYFPKLISLANHGWHTVSKPWLQTEELKQNGKLAIRAEIISLMAWWHPISAEHQGCSSESWLQRKRRAVNCRPGHREDGTICRRNLHGQFNNFMLDVDGASSSLSSSSSSSCLTTTVAHAVKLPLRPLHCWLNRIYFPVCFQT